VYKFQAAVLEELNQPFVIRELCHSSSLDIGQVLVRVKYAGICGAQLGEQAGIKGPDRYLPHCVGHEGGGIVEDTGPGVKYVKPGDHVVIHWRKGVGIDAKFPAYEWAEETRGAVRVGAGANNTWQEYSIVSENRVTKIDDDVPLDIAALLGCAVTTGIGVVANDARVKIGESVIVYGCGGVGLTILQACKLAGAYPIIGVDINPDKLRLAANNGATHSELYLEDHPHADVAIDTTGIPSVMERAWKSADRVCFVAQLPLDKTLSLQTIPFQSGRQLFGSDGGSTNPTVDIPKYIRLYKAGRLPIDNLITHRIKLPQLDETIADIRAGNIGRAVIEL
jgi:S-(hydroxymethyl)glutathione dehydrogenase/alcohol dehydrogenase